MNVKEQIKICNNFYRNKPLEDCLSAIILALDKSRTHNKDREFAKNDKRFMVIDPISIDENISLFETNKNRAIKCFCKNIKNTEEDQISDVFIRLFHLCSVIGIDDIELKSCKNSVLYDPEEFYMLMESIVLDMKINKNFTANITKSLSILIIYCNRDNKNIPIENHIRARLKYKELLHQNYNNINKVNIDS